MARRPALLPPAAFLSVSPPLLGPLLANLDAPAEIRALAKTPAELARALFTSALPEALAGPLHTFAAFATERGYHALCEARFDLARLGVIEPLPDDAFADVSAADLAALAVTRAARGDDAWDRTIERGFHRMHRSLPDPIGYEFWARAPLALDAAGLAAALADLPGLAAPSWIAEDPDGTVHAALFYRGRPLAIVQAGEGGLGALGIEGAVEVEIVSVHPATGRIAVGTRDARRVRALAKVLAQRARVDQETLLARPAFTLQALLDRGVSGLARAELPGRVRGVSVIASQVIAQDGERFEARKKDSLADAAKIAAERDGYLHRATFRFTLEGAATPVDAFVELPNRLGVGEVRWTREIRAALDALGVLAPGLARGDLTTLRRGPRGLYRFVEVFGEAGVAFMTGEGVLQRVPPEKTSAVESSSTRAWGHTVRPFRLRHPLDEGKEYVLADDPIVAARTVGPEHRETWRLDGRALARVMAADLGLHGGAEERRAELPLPDDVLDLGATPDGRARVFYVLAAVAPEGRGELGKALARAALPAHAVLLVPRGRELGRELEVALDLDEQIGRSSVRAKLDAALAVLRTPHEPAVQAPAIEAPPAPTEVVLSVPGSWSKQRTDVAVNGEVRPIQNGGFVVLLAMILAASRTPGGWNDPPKGSTAQGIREAMSRIQRDLADCLPPGFRLLQVRHGRVRLNPAIRVGEVRWLALATEHGDPRVRKLAALGGPPRQRGGG